MCYIDLLYYYRGYAQEKISNNIQCEIFQTILDEAKESYKEDIVHELVSNVPEELERNVEIICQFIQTWRLSKNA